MRIQNAKDARAYLASWAKEPATRRVAAFTLAASSQRRIASMMRSSGRWASPTFLGHEAAAEVLEAEVATLTSAPVSA